jgi:hypothetical protein
MISSPPEVSAKPTIRTIAEGENFVRQGQSGRRSF